MLNDFPMPRTKNLKFLKGFILLELLITIFVFTIGVIGVFNVIQNISFSSQTNSSKLTAAYLAQEGIEKVRYKRDSNWLAKVAWDLDLPAGTETDLLGRFSRTIAIVKPQANKIVVTVQINWQEKEKNYSLSTQTHLYNWLKYE